MKNIKIKKKFLVIGASIVLFILVIVGIILIIVNTKDSNRKEKEKIETKITTYIAEITEEINNLDYDLYSKNFKDYTTLIATDKLYVDNLDSKVNLTKELFRKVKINVKVRSIDLGSDKANVSLTLTYLDTTDILNKIKSNTNSIKSAIVVLKSNNKGDYPIYSNFILDTISKYIGENSTTKNIEFETKISTDKSYTISKDFDIFIMQTILGDENIKNCIEEINSYFGENILDINALDVVYKINNKYSYTIGNGSEEMKAKIGTKVKTKYISGKNIYDIVISVNNILVDEEAKKYANSLHNDNRGILSATSKKLLVINYTITNITEKTLTIKPKFSLSNNFGNILTSTGKLFGINEKGKVKPNESITLETYLFADDLTDLFLVYGKDFNKQYDLVWFE